MIAAMVCTTISAKDFKVIEGNTKCLKDKATATFSVNFDGCTWEKEQSIQEFSGDAHAARAERALNGFITGFNRKSKGLKLASDAEGAKYSVVLKVNNIDRHQGAGLSMWGQMCIAITGTVTFVDNTTGATVMVVDVHEYWGPGDYDPEDRVTKGFNDCGEQIAKL